MNNFRDIEQLSAYLDGELSGPETKRLETRLADDPQLVSVLNDLRSARVILRKLPKHKAPRNFTLTRQMVGLKPPLPRSYSFVRFSTAFATVLLVVSFLFNFMSLGMGGAAPAFEGGYGGGGGGPSADEFSNPRPQSGGGGDSEPELAAEAPAAADESSASGLAPEATMSVGVEQSLPADSAEELVTPTPGANAERVTVPSDDDTQSNKAGANDIAELPEQSPASSQPASTFNWQSFLLGFIALGLIAMFIMRINASRKWR